MDRHQLTQPTDETLFIDSLTSLVDSKEYKEKTHTTVTKPLLAQTKSLPENQLDTYLNQRNVQRWVVVGFFIITTTLSFIILGLIIGIQTYKRFKYPVLANFEVVNAAQLQFLIGTVFVQSIGGLYIITKSLWSEKEQDSLFDLYKTNGK